MARFYADENFPLSVVVHLRRLGHDVLTVQESGFANLRTADSAVLEFAIAARRAVITMNRRHFIRLHLDRPNHSGIVVCTADADAFALAQRIDRTTSPDQLLTGKLFRIDRPG